MSVIKKCEHEESCFYYIVSPGSTLTGIAERLCGNSLLWSVIYERNLDLIADPGRLMPGDLIRIPSELIS